MATTMVTATTVGAIVAATTTADSVLLDPARRYAVHHTGLSPTANTTATNEVILGINAAPGAYDKAAAINKLILPSATVATLPRGTKELFFAVVAAGSACQLNILPDDAE